MHLVRDAAGNVVGVLFHGHPDHTDPDAPPVHMVPVVPVPEGSTTEDTDAPAPEPAQP